jgi:hypothetical protein
MKQKTVATLSNKPMLDSHTCNIASQIVELVQKQDPLIVYLYKRCKASEKIKQNHNNEKELKK